MKDIWIEKFKKSKKLRNGDYVEVLTGFNSNIDSIYSFEELDTDFSGVDANARDDIQSIDDLKENIIFCQEEGVNREIDGSKINMELDGGKKNIGGQGGIMANFLSNLNNSVTFYTPMLSKDLTMLLNKDILYPVMEENEFVLKNVNDCVNTDRTKENMIFEFSNEESCRLIVSDSLKGFGPYFRKGIEENIDKMDDNLDRVLLSGFHDAKGNIEAKLKKSRKQLAAFETPVHVEYVTTDKKRRKLIQDYILPEADSLGMDEYEIKELSSLEGPGDVDLGEAYQGCKELINNYNLSRVHLHTYNYHLTVVEDNYKIESEKIRDSMLFGEVCALQLAGKGDIPTKADIEDFDMDDKYLKRLDHMEDFADYFDLENFVEEGIASIEGYRIVAIPTIIHKESKRLVGMGDVISSAAFTSEIK